MVELVRAGRGPEPASASSPGVGSGRRYSKGTGNTTCWFCGKRGSYVDSALLGVEHTCTLSFNQRVWEAPCESAGANDLRACFPTLRKAHQGRWRNVSMEKMTRRVTPALILAAVAGTAIHAEAQDHCEWTLEETLRIGSIDGDDALSGVLDLDIGPDGMLYVAEQFVPHITVFTLDGRRSHTIGRAGSGPGEFDLSAVFLGWRQDTLWATDRATTHFFPPDGTEPRQVEFRVHRPHEGSRLIPRRPLADGTFLARRVATTAGGGSMEDFFGAQRLPVLRVSASGRIVDTVDTIALARQQRSVGIDHGSRRGTGYAEHPLNGSWGSFVRFTPSIDGSSIFMIGEIRDDERPASFDLLQIDLSGDTLMERTITYEPRPVTDQDLTWLTERFASYQAGDYNADSGRSSPFPTRDEAARERDRQAARESITFPEHHPPVRQIVAGDDGTIWMLRELDLPDLVDRWEVYGPTGKLEGTVLIREGRSARAPWYPRLNVLHATRDELWGASVGELDVPYIHRYRVDAGCR